MKNRLIAFIALFLIGTIVLAQPLPVFAATAKEEACSGVNVSGQTSCTNAAPNLNGVIARVVDLASVAMGIIAVVMLIYGGLKYVMSGGDSSDISAAKNTILYALVGLALVALAQLIVRFVVQSVT